MISRDVVTVAVCTLSGYWDVLASDKALFCDHSDSLIITAATQAISFIDTGVMEIYEMDVVDVSGGCKWCSLCDDLVYHISVYAWGKETE